jgi:hypothetical protein
MTSTRILSLLAVGAIFAATASWTAYRRELVRNNAHAQASWKSRQVLREAKEFLNTRLGEAEARANTAASLDSVRALVAQGADRSTLKHAFQAEPWWVPYRDEFPIQLLTRGSEVIDLSRDQASQKLKLGALTSRALAKSTASGFSIVDNRVYLVSAAAIDVPVGTRWHPAALVLGKALPAEDLLQVAGKIGSALVLSYDNQLLLGAGPAAQQSKLATLVGHEERALVLSMNRTWAGACIELGDGLFAWSYVDTTEIVDQARWSAMALFVPLWGAAIVVAAVLLAFTYPTRAGAVLLPLTQPGRSRSLRY